MSTTTTKRTTKAKAEQAEAPEVPSNLAHAATVATPEVRAEQAETLARAGFDQGDATMVTVALRTVLDAEQANQARTVITTIRNRTVIGQACDYLARLARLAKGDPKTGGKAVTPAEAEAAARASGLTEVQLSRTTIGLSLRTMSTFFGVVDGLTVEARDLFGEPDGPAKWTATDVLVWAEAKAGKGTESNRGKRPATLAEAEAKGEARTKAEQAAEATAKARRTVLAEQAATTPSAKVGTVITIGKLNGLSTENLTAIRQACDDILATREAEAKAAKAEAEAKGKATKAEAEAEAKAIREAAKAEAEQILADALAKVAK